MGFALQLLSNGLSRLIYIYLLGRLNQLPIDYATPHATLLANANGLSALFSLSVYQHYVARQTSNIAADLQSCQTQFKVLCMLWALSAIALLGSEESSMIHHAMPTLIAAIGLALPELTFTMASARGKSWKSVLFYGGHAIFFCGYALAVFRHESPERAVLYAALPTVIINLAAYQILKSRNVKKEIFQALALLGSEVYIRLQTLIASLPGILTPSAMVYGLRLHPETSAQIPQMLLFSSFVGALVFMMGNLFQHYGSQLLPKLLEIQKQGLYKKLLSLIVGTFLTCLILSIPADFLLIYFKESFQHNWSNDWYIYAAIAATGTVTLQWHTVICIHHSRTNAILWPNILYLLMATLMTATSGLTHIHVFSIIGICAALRLIINMVDFSLIERPSWRT